jgi:alpha-N-arabinofuranosidase
VFVKLVNASSVQQTVDFKIAAANGIAGSAAVTTLSGNTTQETNSIDDRTRIVPVTSTIQNAGLAFRRVVPRYSIQVLDISLK